MKIAIIGFGFMGATLPLAKELAKNGHNVDCYYFVCYSRKIKFNESLDYEEVNLVPGCESLLAQSNIIYEYVPYPNVKIRILPLLVTNNSSIKNICNIYNHLSIIHLSRKIIKRRYDYVDVILHTELECFLYEKISKHVQCVCSLHEVLRNLNDEKKELSYAAKFVIKQHTEIIVHSEKTQKDLLEYSKGLSLSIKVIPFGAFDSYHVFEQQDLFKEIPDNIILFIGSIQPYKGLSILYNAVDMLSDKFQFKIVVAGKGNDACLDKMVNDNRYILINRFLDNSEIVGLIKKCKVVVCPYLSASQTGIVPLAMSFNKPSIVTNVGAFPELIKDGENGYMVESNDYRGLVEALIRVYDNFAEYNKIVKNISSGSFFSWDNIAQKYIDLIKH
jgi:glycosyltransferase involved in cell wall biosynthesis